MTARDLLLGLAVDLLCCSAGLCLWSVAAQEYTEEFRDITKGAKSKESLPVAPITLINQRPVGDDLHVRILVFIYFSFVDFNGFRAINYFIYE